MLYLWHLGWIDEPEVWYDKTFGFVVVAESEDAARQIVSQEADYRGRPFPETLFGDEGAAPWLDAAQTFCIQLEADQPRVVLVDKRKA